MPRCVVPAFLLEVPVSCVSCLPQHFGRHSNISSWNNAACNWVLFPPPPHSVTLGTSFRPQGLSQSGWEGEETKRCKGITSITCSYYLVLSTSTILSTCYVLTHTHTHAVSILSFCPPLSLSLSLSLSEGRQEVKIKAKSRVQSLTCSIVSSVYPRVRRYRHTEMHAEACMNKGAFVLFTY